MADYSKFPALPDPMFLTAGDIGYDSIKEVKTKVIGAIERRAKALSLVYNELNDIEDIIEMQRMTEKLAFTQAYREIAKNIPLIVNMAVQEAISETVEYNFQPYVLHLLTAVNTNIDKLIIVRPNLEGRSVFVETHFEVLGMPDEWFQIVDQVKEEGGFGNVNDVQKRSHMWMEKIYKTGREGRQLKRRRKDGSEYDITERWNWRYAVTVLARLSKLRTDKAPYWYFIEYGNVGVGGREGTPYPVIERVEPGRMVDRTVLRIQDMFDYAFTVYYAKAQSYIAKLVARTLQEAGLSIDRSIDSLDRINNQLEVSSAKLLEDVEAWRGEIRFNSERIIKELSDIDLEYVTFVSGGKSITRARNAKTKKFI